MKKTIKTLKHRFWTEVHDGAKLFYLKGMKFGRYMKIDVRNLSRYMSLQKFRPLVWRNSHSYVLVDRLLDVTPPDEVARNKKTDRNVCFYGYVRGAFENFVSCFSNFNDSKSLTIHSNNLFFICSSLHFVSHYQPISIDLM